MVDQQGLIWIGTEQGLNSFDIKKAQLTVYKQIADETIFSLYADKKKRLWVGTQQGIALFDKKQANLTAFFITQSKNCHKKNASNA